MRRVCHKKVTAKELLRIGRIGLRLESVYQEPPCKEVSRNLSTIVNTTLCQASLEPETLPGLRRRRTGLLFSGSKSSFLMKVIFASYMGMKNLECGGRGERGTGFELLEIQCEVSTVSDGLGCHVMSSSCVGHL